MTDYDESQNRGQGIRSARKARADRSKRKSISAACADQMSGPAIACGTSVSLRPSMGVDADTGSALNAGAGRNRTPANDNRNDVAILRRDGGDPAVVIGLALHHVRLGRDVPFAIVNALFRHTKAGDGAAQATVEMLRRRAERRQTKRWQRYVGMGLRAPGRPGPHGQDTRLELVHSRSAARSDEAGR